MSGKLRNTCCSRNNLTRDKLCNSQSDDIGDGNGGKGDGGGGEGSGGCSGGDGLGIFGSLKFRLRMGSNLLATAGVQSEKSKKAEGQFPKEPSPPKKEKRHQLW